MKQEYLLEITVPSHLETTWIFFFLKEHWICSHVLPSHGEKKHSMGLLITIPGFMSLLDAREQRMLCLRVTISSSPLPFHTPQPL